MASRSAMLATRRAELALTAAAVSNELWREPRSQRARDEAIARQWVLSDDAHRVTLITHDMAQGIAKPSVQ
jgi:hypothetical protein